MAQTARLHLMISLRLGLAMYRVLSPLTKPWHQCERPPAQIGACLCAYLVQHLMLKLLVSKYPNMQFCPNLVPLPVYVGLAQIRCSGGKV